MSTAFHLANNGIKDITIIEKDSIGSGSSSQAAGIVTCLQWNATSVVARMKTLDLFENFSKVLDGYTFQQVGCLNLSTKSDYNEGSDLRKLHDRLGAKYETYIGKELTEKFSDVKTTDDEYGVAAAVLNSYDASHRAAAASAGAKGFGGAITANDWASTVERQPLVEAVTTLARAAVQPSTGDFQQATAIPQVSSRLVSGSARRMRPQACRRSRLG